jgi:GntR family transcriptional regulator
MTFIAAQAFHCIALPAACCPYSYSIYRLTGGEVVEVAFNLHPADRFTYSVTLQRRG